MNPKEVWQPHSFQVPTHYGASLALGACNGDSSMFPHIYSTELNEESLSCALMTKYSHICDESSRHVYMFCKRNYRIYVKDDNETTWTVEMLLFNLPPILSEPQYLLCWLITFLIVSKQLKKSRRQVTEEIWHQLSSLQYHRTKKTKLITWHKRTITVRNNATFDGFVTILAIVAFSRFVKVIAWQVKFWTIL